MTQIPELKVLFFFHLSVNYGELVLEALLAAEKFIEEKALVSR